jgi:uncharacterized repeat protein (TIGR03803 family)
MKLDPAGNLYGTTIGGGLGGAGTVFKLAPDGTYTVLHYFDPRNGDGQFPVGGLARDAAGNIYGTTVGSGGISNGGVVFQLAPDGTETILHRFVHRRDGFFPEGDLRRTRSGFLYGTATDGGESGGGIVFRLGPDGHENILHSFGAKGDGGLPIPGLTPGPDHGFYGVAEAGGAKNLGAIFWIHN